MPRPAFLLLALALGAGAAAAQPDRPPAVEKARARFETDVAKAEEALLAALDKALAKAKAAKDKPAVEKLTAEKEQFAGARVVPTAVPAAAYLKQRAAAAAALERAYDPAVKEARQAKKDAEADALEAEWSDLLKGARGYGLAIPDVDAKAAFYIESPATGLVVEATKAGHNELVLEAKDPKKKALQVWTLEREPKGYAIRNGGNGQYFNIPGGTPVVGATLYAWPQNRPREATANAVFQLAELRREVVITGVLTGLVAAATERKVKGVTTVYVTQERKETPPPASQRWLLVEAK